MRQLLFAVLTVLLFLSWKVPANNPLQNTQWAGEVNILDPSDGIFVFTADTTTLYVGGSVIETMLYKVNDDTLRLIKASGMSQCSTSDTGYYKFNIKDSTLTIAPLKDNCTDRSSAFTAEGYKPSHTSF